MNRTKITILAGIASSLIIAGSSAWSAQTCDSSIASKHSVKPYYPKGFFSESNPLNPLTLMPEEQMKCEAEARALEAKVDHDVSVAVIQERAAGAWEPGYIKSAEVEENAGSAALGNGDDATALQHFDAAEQSLGRG